MNLLQKSALQLRQESMAKHFQKFQMSQNLNNFKNNLLYGHKNNSLNCGLMLGNMNTGAYRGGGWTFEEPFTDSQGVLDARWSKSGTGTAPDATNDRANWVGTRTTTINSISADPLGGVMSDTALVFRLKNRTLNSTGGTYSSYAHFLLSANDHSVNTETATDWLGWKYRARNSNPRIVYIGAGDGIAVGALGEVALTTIFANATDYWEQFIRLSATSTELRRFSDAYTSLIEAKSNTIASTIQNLRYIKFINYNVAPAGADNFNGYLTDIQFANGVTVPP